VRGDRIVFEAVEQHWRLVLHFKRLVLLKVPESAHACHAASWER